jgi:hypothetical protein
MNRQPGCHAVDPWRPLRTPKEQKSFGQSMRATRQKKLVVAFAVPLPDNSPSCPICSISKIYQLSGKNALPNATQSVQDRKTARWDTSASRTAAKRLQSSSTSSRQTMRQDVSWQGSQTGRARISFGHNGTPRGWTPKLVIGTDGRRSAVRRHAPVPLPRHRDGSAGYRTGQPQIGQETPVPEHPPTKHPRSHSRRSVCRT